MDSSSDQILPQLRQKVGCWHSNGSRNTDHTYRGFGVCVTRGCWEWAQGKGVFRGVQQTGKHTENKEGIGYMTGTGESLADTHIHMNRHMEAGGATLGFTVL